MPAPADTSAGPHHDDAPERMLATRDVAALFSVDPSTVQDWANAGKLSVIRTLGGHRRYRESEVRALLAERETRRQGAA